MIFDKRKREKQKNETKKKTCPPSLFFPSVVFLFPPPLLVFLFLVKNPDFESAEPFLDLTVCLTV
jgi:hypothetical protein